MNKVLLKTIFSTAVLCSSLAVDMSTNVAEASASTLVAPAEYRKNRNIEKLDKVLSSANSYTITECAEEYGLDPVQFSSTSHMQTARNDNLATMELCVTKKVYSRTKKDSFRSLVNTFNNAEQEDIASEYFYLKQYLSERGYVIGFSEEDYRECRDHYDSFSHFRKDVNDNNGSSIMECLDDKTRDNLSKALWLFSGLVCFAFGAHEFSNRKRPTPEI